MSSDLLASGEAVAVPLTQSSAGRASGISWKLPRLATRRSQRPDSLKTKKWEDRMEKSKQQAAIKKLQAELREEKESEIARRKQITLERKKAAEERQRLEEAKAKMGARRAARMLRKAGRTKKING